MSGFSNNGINCNGVFLPKKEHVDTECDSRKDTSYRPLQVGAVRGIASNDDGNTLCPTCPPPTNKNDCCDPIPSTETYLGVKMIEATKMGSSTFNRDFKPDKYNPQAETESGYYVKYPDGYVSWSPKKAFEDAYRRTNNLTLGLAIEAIKMGKKVARIGWNGKGMWLRLYHPYLDKEFPIKELNPCEGTPIQWIGMKTADNCFVPWLASQTDMLAEDYIIID